MADACRCSEATPPCPDAIWRPRPRWAHAMAARGRRSAPSRAALAPMPQRAPPRHRKTSRCARERADFF
eukprot:6456842-Pyramimonas_sp.AAC.1